MNTVSAEALRSRSSSNSTMYLSAVAHRFLGSRLIIIVDWRRRNYTALEGRSVLNIRFYYYEERRSGVRTARGGRLRAITFDIRNYSSAECGAGEAGSFRHSAGRTKRSRVASARAAPRSLAALCCPAVCTLSAWTSLATSTATEPRISHTLPKYTRLALTTNENYFQTFPYFAIGGVLSAYDYRSLIFVGLSNTYIRYKNFRKQLVYRTNRILF